MGTPRASLRRKFDAKPHCESLEHRSLMTGGAGNTFALIPGTITQAGGTTSIQFTIDPTSNFRLPRNGMTLGVDVAAMPGSTVLPFIQSIDDPHGNIVPGAFHSIYNPHLRHAQVAAGAGTQAMLVPISLKPHQPNVPVTYTVNVVGESNSSGQFLLDFYLPGDVNGDGVVDKTDLTIERSLQGVTSSSQNYNFNADLNRDGRIGPIDLAFTKQNQGVRTTITPSISSNLVAAPNLNLPARTSTTNSVVFQGTASPGSTVTYQEINKLVPPVSTVTDGNGNYTIQVALAPGANTFNVSATDGFGQTVSGPISPVTFKPRTQA